MASVARDLLAGSDGYRVLGGNEVLGRVEELWLGTADEPVAAVVRLVDERRGLVVAEDVLAVGPAEESLTLAPEARLIRLDPPHIEPESNGLSSATWRATGDALELPAPHPHQRLGLLDHRARPFGQSARPERPVWRTIVTLYLFLAGIVCSIIGLDILIAYLVTGSPPY
jgi:hypothetical protein